MDPTKLALANAFLDAEPEAAARLLEQQPVEQVAALIAAAPRSHALRAMEVLLPRVAAQVLQQLYREGADAASRIVAGLSVHRAAMLLRLLPVAEQLALLERLSLKARAALRLLLNYSEEQVGAWMETDIPLLPLNISVGEALAQLRRDDSASMSDQLFVITGGGLLAGCCSLLRCLRASDMTPLRQLMEPAPQPLGGRTTLSAALAHPCWEHGDSAPIIDRRQHVLGQLTHHRLRQLLHQGGDEVLSGNSGDMMLLVGEAYGASLRGLFGNFAETSAGAASNTKVAGGFGHDA